MPSTGQRHAIELAESFAGVARLLAAEDDVEGVLARVVSIAVDLVDNCDFAGITEITGRNVRSTVASSDAAKAVDQAQDDHGEGPCLDAISEHEVFLVDHLSRDERWPAFAHAAHEATGVESVVSFRLFEGDNTMGALNLYSRAADAFDDEQVAIASVLAAHAAVALANAQEVAHLKQALTSRDVIGRAKGVLMARSGVSDDEAFAMLRAASQRMNVKLRDIAQRVADQSSSAGAPDLG